MMVGQGNAKERVRIGRDMLHRYTGCHPDELGSYILLTNFNHYLLSFSDMIGVSVKEGSSFKTVTDTKSDMTMIQFNIGAPTAALVIDLLSTIHPKAVLMLGMCGGLHQPLKIGEFVLPMAAIRNEGVSKHYMPPEVPSLPTFRIQTILAETLKKNAVSFKTGVIHSTDYRFWEFDEYFKEQLVRQRAIAIEMECAALFTVAFKMKVPIGALLLVSDMPLVRGGIKTLALQKKIFKDHLKKHLSLGLETLKAIRGMSEDIDLRHFQW